MRGADEQQEWMFSYISAEKRVPKDHPLRTIRTMVDVVLKDLSPLFESLYAKTGRPSIAPEKLLRTLLLQVLYSVRSERLLMEQLDYNLLYRWFVGLSMDDNIWDATVFSKNRDRLLEGDIASAFFERILCHARAQHLLSDEHFTVDGTLIEAWAGQKSFKIIANLVRDETEGLEIFRKILSVADRFLDVYLDFLGYIPSDGNINFATRKRKLWAEHFPQTSATKALNKICERLVV